MPAPRNELLSRLDREVGAFAEAVRTATGAGQHSFEHGFFGQIGIGDYVLFNARHLDHHRAQLPGAAG